MRPCRREKSLGSDFHPFDFVSPTPQNVRRHFEILQCGTNQSFLTNKTRTHIRFHLKRSEKPSKSPETKSRKNISVNIPIDLSDTEIKRALTYCISQKLQFFVAA